ncbi:putative quinol monooxygenase [Sphingomonas cavernae]|uniref:Antibiotic biosynthesis monooxygenase n=1 Tax=Sphingomonas cavernae TaxID=2320861 RepID=A0A418W753_9SPHN|nr:antibiotic biosynthesis monooxygenase family protein [Sphingomonas cavernae]RJF85876.1 antibiotic biosynthesis monooxygenase [Sphingomonas cavernae]
MTRWLAPLLLALAPAALAAAEPAKGIVMVGEMIAHPGKGDALYARMQREIPPIPQTKGRRAYEVVRDGKNPDRVVIVEIWDSAEDHAASVKQIDPQAIREVKALMASMKGETFKR